MKAGVLSRRYARAFFKLGVETLECLDGWRAVVTLFNGAQRRGAFRQCADLSGQCRTAAHARKGRIELTLAPEEDTADRKEPNNCEKAQGQNSGFD